ncbi:MAG: hypothetical protein WBC18_14615 [Ottowia sp.]|uniref:hypothetical protein n=1 Tax=Ottowia sp. TaxID=1898956 RepID=UPI003C763B3C
MSAVIEKPRVAKPPKARAQSKAKAPSTVDAVPSAEWSFMEGKALAALMVRESGFRRGGDRADLNASYREPGEAQDNFTRPFLELVMKEPQLLAGFSAALSSMFAEGFDPGLANLAHQADCTAKINYSACTTYRNEEEYEDFNSHSEPPLDEQLAKFALQDLATPSAGESAVAAPAPAPATKSLITAETPITEAGVAAENLALWCSHDIKTLADEVTLLGEEATVEGQTRMGALLRCYGTRIAELNGAIMSHLSGDSVMTMRDLQRAHYRGAKFFQPQEVDRD